MNRYFKNILGVLLLCCGFITVRAQHNHFIYLQTENKQPFYIKLDKKILSSSASGYLIIPKLTDGSYTLTLGFPKNEWPEQNVTCVVDKKDAGYVVKNFGEKGWGFFNWQTMNVVMADKKEDPVVVVEEKKEVMPAAKTTVADNYTTAAQPKEIINSEPVKPTILVSRILTNKSADGIEMIFTDVIKGATDTIRIFIPIEKTKETPVIPPKQEEVRQQPEPKVEKAVNEVVKENTSPATDTAKTEGKKEAAQEIQKAPIETTQKEPLQTTKEIKEQPASVDKPLIKNSDCKAFASEDDFMKLRKKMAAENNDDDMVAAAKKIFKAKCFTVEQIKNLSVLFLNDAGKYKFFDAAYPFVSDSYNFSNLETLLTDEYYINRFKAMIRH